MSMFVKSVKANNIGLLKADGKSKVWEGVVDIGDLGEKFLIRVHGTEHGPTEIQSDSFGALLSNSPTIKAAAAAPIVEYLASCGVAPEDVDLTPETVWQHLSPSFVEIHRDNEYSAGSGPAGSIAISIGFEIPWEPYHLLQLGVVDGHLGQIYSE